MTLPTSLFCSATLRGAAHFTLHSGVKTSWLINCSALLNEDWAVIAELAAARLPDFGLVVPVLNGGLPFAQALRKYQKPACPRTLICDDVFTTGASMEEYRQRFTLALGVVAFARGKCPDWIRPVFALTQPEPIR